MRGSLAEKRDVVNCCSRLSGAIGCGWRGAVGFQCVAMLASASRR